jgi:hypothetical protein
MALDLTAIIARQKAAADHLGQEVTYSGTDYRCYPTSMRDTDLRNRGQTFRDEYMESISVFNSDVTIPLSAVVTRNGTVRRVIDFSDSPDGIQRVLHLGKQFGE